MLHTPKTFSVYLVEVLSPRGAGAEPSAFSRHLEASDRGTIPRRVGEDRLYFFTCHTCDVDLHGRESQQYRFFLGGCRGLNAFVEGLAVLPDQLSVDFTRVALRLGRDLSCEQRHQDTVFVRGPDATIQPCEGGASTLFSPESERPIK